MLEAQGLICHTGGAIADNLACQFGRHDMTGRYTMLDRIGDILGGSPPGEVRSPVIDGIPVEMPSDRSLWSWPHEGFENKGMDGERGPGSPAPLPNAPPGAAQADATIPLDARGTNQAVTALRSNPAEV